MFETHCKTCTRHRVYCECCRECGVHLSQCQCDPEHSPARIAAEADAWLKEQGLEVSYS